MSHDYQYPEENCPNCNNDELTPTWYRMGGVESFKGNRCDSCHTHYIRSADGSDEVKTLSESEVDNGE